MSSRLKGIALCVIATMVGLVVWDLVIGVNPNPMGVLIVGGGLGIITGLAISFIKGGQLAIPVGIATPLVLWFALAAIMVDEFGTSGFDVTKFISITIITAAIGAFAGFAYKFGAR